VIHNYLTTLPNLITRNVLRLTPYEMMLYLAFFSMRQSKSSADLAEECGMSVRSIQRAKKSLMKPRKELGGKSLISVESRLREDGGTDMDFIEVTDIMDENIDYFSNKDR